MSRLRPLLAAAGPATAGLLPAVLAGAGAAGAAVGLMAVSAWLISRAALHPPVLHLMVAIVAVRAFGLSRGVLRYVERLTGHDAALRVLGRLRVRVFTRLADLAPAGLAGYRRADLAHRLAADVDAVLDMLTRVVLPYAVATLVGAGSVVLVGAYSKPAALALAGGLLLVGAVVPAVRARAAGRADGRLAPLRAELAIGTTELVEGLPDLLAYGASGARLTRLADTGVRLGQAEQRSSAMAGLAAAVTALVTGICLLVGLAAGAVAVRAGALPGELLALVVLTPLAVFETAAGLPAAAQHFAAARASLRRLADVLATPVRITAPDAPVDLPDGPHTVRLEAVTAGWTPGRAVLHDVDLELRPGARVALVGPSGCGKSTVAALLVRFLDPTTGRVTLDGIDLRRIAPERLRQIVGYLPDDAHLFDTTIAANLRIGRQGATDEQLRDVLAQVRLLDWVTGLPDGLATLVGEHGRDLSGGQRRRLALARALLADFPVLILDEPTEHLDDDTAATLLDDLLAAAGHRTVLLITHRTDLGPRVDEVLDLGQRPAAVAAGRGAGG
ncbi:thiol reductant ABC exporter subunit CydC [Actinoplanes oblitus]|uniref:Thiol reductant ABC exporter subunit CydC n=1 Tax=Actinoplanes oblitus TaxID=3040509 RepID=A0ABY8WAU1_9ACTN|nr:thiol reductant ABC exporter subunit CydC [Actinoplanes oblitus]WIM94487.1 thiol reductant ABC exporter subunit CydC [Actinoplanes oblitus]